MFDTDLADVDEDGWLDIGSNSFGASAGLHVYRNNGDGSWTQTWGFVGGNSTDDCLFGDVNADGHADFVAAHQSGTVYLGDGTGHFVNADGNLPSGGTLGRQGISLGDVDNDGDLDLAFKVSGGALQVWLWNGDGTWSSAVSGLPTSGIAATQLADMDGDGWCDVIGLGNGVLRIWLGNGGATWTLATQIAFPTPGYFAALRAGGDVDHNGRPDFASVTEEGGTYTSYNHLRVFRESSPAPVDLSVRFVSPRGGERMIGGSVRFLDWMSAVPAGRTATIGLDLSTSGPSGPWTPIANGLADGGRLQWRVPVFGAAVEAYFRVRATAGELLAEAVTPRAITILPPAAASVGAGGPDPVRGALRLAPNPSAGAVRLCRGSDGSRRDGEPRESEDVESRVTPWDGAERALRIFDGVGRLVRALPAGSAAWDGRDDGGRALAPGVYFLREGQETARLVVVR
jgi:hypothetical protein